LAFFFLLIALPLWWLQKAVALFHYSINSK